MARARGVAISTRLKRKKRLQSRRFKSRFRFVLHRNVGPIFHKQSVLLRDVFS